MTRPLIDRHDGDPSAASAAAASVRQHFQNKFSSDCAPVPHDFLQDLPDEEPPWTLHEVGRAVAALKPNKTTGISRINVAMLKSLVDATFGLELLTELLNAFLRSKVTAGGGEVTANLPTLCIVSTITKYFNNIYLRFDFISTIMKSNWLMLHQSMKQIA